MFDATQLKSDLHQAWNRKLILWWEYYNDLYLKGALRRPGIHLGYAEGADGQWDPTHRTITLSVRHIESSSWLAVMDTLRHEMAHQVVDELLKPVGEPPHGPAFRQAAQRLRCDGLSSGVQEPQETQHDERIHRLIRKVLSLASSPNPHEAEAAMKKARHLLMKYNIDLVELDKERGFQTRHLGKAKGRHTAAELWMASLLNRFFFVEVLWQRTYDAHRDQLGTVLQVFGTPQNLDMAEHVYTYLNQLMPRFWEEYKEKNGIQSNRERQRYFAGLLQGFYAKLEAQEERLETGHALVWQGDPRLKAYYRHLNPRVTTSSGGGVQDSAAYRHGVQDGGRVTIHRPIHETSKGVAGYLGE